MAELTTLARPYAVAAYQRAKQTGATDRWSEGIAFLAALVADDRVRQAVANPRSDRQKLTAALIDLCRDRTSEEVQNFLRLLIQNRRLTLIPQIAALFERFKASDEGLLDVDVCTAFPLEHHEFEQLTEQLNRAFGRRCRLRTLVDPELIAGVVIRADDKVIDASIRGQLTRLAKRLGRSEKARTN